MTLNDDMFDITTSQSSPPSIFSSRLPSPNDNTFDISTSRSSPPHFSSSRSPSPSNESVQSTFTEYHPFINGESIKLHRICFLSYQQRYVGEPCNEDEIPLLDLELPPPVIKPRKPNDWMPYKDHIAFEATEYFFKSRKMSKANIDFLCQPWAASPAPYHDMPPFSNQRDKYIYCLAVVNMPCGGTMGLAGHGLA